MDGRLLVPIKWTTSVGLEISSVVEFSLASSSDSSFRCLLYTCETKEEHFMYLVSQHSIRKLESLECTDLMCLSQRAVVGARKLDSVLVTGLTLSPASLRSAHVSTCELFTREFFT